MQELKYTLPFVLLFGVSAADAGGFRNSQAPVSSVQSISSAPDGAPVTVRGEISSQESREHYVLSDNTGSVLVSVDGSSIDGPLAEGAPVEVEGEIGRQAFGQPQIEASSVTVLAWNSAPASLDGNPPIHGGRGYLNFESD